MISFELPSVDSVPRFMDALRVIIPAVSLGGTESLITHPFSETHREFPEERRRRLGIMPGLMRLSVGLEYLDDLLADLDQALNAL
jgi:cystathionine beta-lyase/cystathionine gamma-synthase